MYIIMSIDRLGEGLWWRFDSAFLRPLKRGVRFFKKVQKFNKSYGLGIVQNFFILVAGICGPIKGISRST